MVDVDVIQRLVELMVENDLAEISLRDGEENISLKKGQTPQMHSMPMHAMSIPQMHSPAAAPVPSAAAAPPAVEEDPDAGLVPVLSPMVGTFYAAPDPSSPPFVNVGDTLTPDTVVCIIEAMKVFNEIKAGVAGRVERVVVTNEAAVEYDQPLFMVRPA